MWTSLILMKMLKLHSNWSGKTEKKAYLSIILEPTCGIKSIFIESDQFEFNTRYEKWARCTADVVRNHGARKSNAKQPCKFYAKEKRKKNN